MYASTLVLKAGAQCGSPARWDLCGGPLERVVPTAICSKSLLGLSTAAQRSVNSLKGWWRELLVLHESSSFRERRGQKAANFLQVGNTLGYARWNGAFVHHGYKKTCWLYPLHKNAATILASDFDHPLLSKDKEVEMVDLNRLVIDGDQGIQNS